MINYHVSKWTPSEWIPFTPSNVLQVSSCGGLPSTGVSELLFDNNGILYAAWGCAGALAIDTFGNIFVGGDFDTAGGLPANNIAQWDGKTWSALGSGINGTVQALAVDNAGNLYAGGIFTKAGNKTVTNIAQCRYRELAISNKIRPARMEPFSIAPRFSRNTALFVLQSKIAGQANIRISNLLGKEIFSRTGVPLPADKKWIVQPQLFMGKGLYLVSASLEPMDASTGVRVQRITQRVLVK